MRSEDYPRCIEHLHEIVHTMSSASPYERVFHLIVYRLTKLLGCRTCAIVLINPRTEYLNIANSCGLSHTFCTAFRKMLATGSVGNLLWTGTPVVIVDSALQPELARELQLEYPFGSCIAVQIAIHHRTLGYLFVDSASPHAFDVEQLPLIQLCADLSAVAYHTASLSEENLRLERIDREVGVEKYPMFLERLKSSLDLAHLSDRRCSIMILDVDNYKSIVHTYGQDVGIELLRDLADLLRNDRKSVRAVGRYGFDEFIVLLDELDLAGAVSFGEGFCRTVSSVPLTKHGIRSSVSIGISCYPNNATSLEDLITAAKNALFEAQRSGKNRVYHFKGEWYAKESPVEMTLEQGGGSLQT